MNNFIDEVKNFIEDHLYKILLGMLVVIILFGILIMGMLNKKSQQPVRNDQATITKTMANSSGSDGVVKNNSGDNSNDNSKIVYVDVKGAVNSPGVYQVKMGMRSIDAIKLAGGFSSSADKQHINLAQKLTDQQIIYVPIKGEVKSSLTQFSNLNSGTNKSNSEGGESTDATDSSKVNLNTANAEKLMELNGIGEKKASQIISYRKSHGKFRTVDELKEVPGFGEKTLANLKSLICV